jgi:hypothetical protein
MLSSQLGPSNPGGVMKAAIVFHVAHNLLCIFFAGIGQHLMEY